MDKEQLHSALLLLMSKLEDIKSNPMQDKTFVVALTEVLRYFRDNGELKEAFKQHKAIIADMEKQPFCKAIMDMFCAKITAEHPELPPLNIKETVEKLSSDEFIVQVNGNCCYGFIIYSTFSRNNTYNCRNIDVLWYELCSCVTYRSSCSSIYYHYNRRISSAR